MAEKSDWEEHVLSLTGYSVADYSKLLSGLIRHLKQRRDRSGNDMEVVNKKLGAMARLARQQDTSLDLHEPIDCHETLIRNIESIAEGTPQLISFMNELKAKYGSP